MPRRLLSISLFLVAAIGLDQATKVIAQNTLRGQGTTRFLADTFRLTYAENPGAFLGLGGSLPDWMRTVLFVLFTALLVFGMAYVLIKDRIFGEALNTASASALALLCAGGVGNLIDRVFRDGVVVDFMNMGIGGLRTGIFNVADIYIMVGAFMMAVLSLRKDGKKQDNAENDAPSATSEPSA